MQDNFPGNRRERVRNVLLLRSSPRAQRYKGKEQRRTVDGGRLLLKTDELSDTWLHASVGTFIEVSSQGRSADRRRTLALENSNASVDALTCAPQERA